MKLSNLCHKKRSGVWWIDAPKWNTWDSLSLPIFSKTTLSQINAKVNSTSGSNGQTNAMTSSRRSPFGHLRGVTKLLLGGVLLLFVFSPTPVFAGEMANQFTISIWVNPTTSIASKALVDKDTEVRIVTDSSGDPQCQIYASGAWQTAITSSTALSLNTWANVSCTYDKANIKVFVNGVQTGTGAQTNALNDAATNLLVGQDDTAAYANFIGTTDQLLVYNYARTAQQIVQDMNAGHPPPGSPVGSPLGYWKFDEGFGITANNSGNQGSTLNGTLTNMSSPATSTSGWTQAGKFGKALNFDGTNDYVSMGNNSSLQNSNGTITAWINTSNGGTSYRGIVVKQNAYGMFLKDNVFMMYDWGAAADRSSGVNLGDGSWHHVACSFQSGVTNGTLCYIDGNLRLTTTITVSDQTQALLVGFGNTGSQYFTGSIDEVKVYNSALTADQVKQDMNRSQAQVLGALSDNSSYQKQAANQEYCVPGDSTSCSSPVGEWRFEEGSGTSAQDTSGGNGTGTITGATYTTGKIGKALNFNGSSDSVTVSNSLSLKTISFWVNPSTTTQNLIDLRTAATAANVSVSGGTVSATGFSTPAIYVNGIVNGAISANAWNFVEITTGTAITANAINFGRISSTSLTGKLDQIRIFDYARSAAQVEWDYNRGAPVGYWKFDECQGTITHDSSVNGNGQSNGNIGTITIGASGTQTAVGTCTDGTGTTPWSKGETGKYNASLSFDGTDDYVSLLNNGNIFSYEWNDPFSIALYVKVPSTAAAAQEVFSKRLNTGVQSGYVINVQTTGKLAFGYTGVSGNGLSKLATSSIADNQWHHLVFVNTASATPNLNNINLYIDGQLASATTAVNTLIASDTIKNTASVVIGARNGLSNFLGGQVDDARVYNYALTAAQIKILSNQNAAIRYGPATGAP